MTIARGRLVDTSVTRWYHCITRCVRRALLLSEGAENRKDWIERRLAELAEIFAVGVGGFAVLDNHLHILIRIDPETAANWSDEEVVSRWGKLFPPRGKDRKPLELPKEWVQKQLDNQIWVAKTRERLHNLGWFMKCLKEPLARMANREDGVKGAFFEGRFKSVAVLDEEALLATCVYIDLNPVAAGIAPVPETSPHTSIKQRVDHVRKQQRFGDLEAARISSAMASERAGKLEEGHWLCPIEDRRRFDSSREGMIEGFGIGSYLLLLDYTGRMFRDGKASINEGLAEVFTRLGTDGEMWRVRIQHLRIGRFLGRYFASTRDRLRQVATQIGRHHLANLAACPTR